jgi:hypothetical protein
MAGTHALASSGHSLNPAKKPPAFSVAVFSPPSPDPDEFDLCRNLRVQLAGLVLSLGNHPILRKGQGIAAPHVRASENVGCAPPAWFSDG